MPIAAALALSLCVLVADPAAKPVAPFPHIRVDAAAKTIEVEASVPIDAHARDSRGEPMRVFLEIIACSPDTREHETLVVTSARASHLHAALLLLGLTPGRPAAWNDEPDGGVAFVQPEGDRVTVEFVRTGDDGKEIAEPPTAWIKNVKTGENLAPRQWVFAGSKFVTRQGRERYDADGAGTIIGLHTFGSEVLAFPDGFNPESAVEEPVWVADPARTPKVGTPVTIRIRPAKRE